MARFKRGRVPGVVVDGAGDAICGCRLCLARCTNRLLVCDDAPDSIKAMVDFLSDKPSTPRERTYSEYVNSVVDKGDKNPSEAARMISEEYWARVANYFILGRTCT
jgi:hypothetical protein